LFPLNSINKFVIVAETECVFGEVRNGFLNAVAYLLKARIVKPAIMGSGVFYAVRAEIL
jgi:hypothetical protein